LYVITFFNYNQPKSPWNHGTKKR